MRLGCLVLLAFGAVGMAQSVPDAIVFKFEARANAIPSYTFVVQGDGSAIYTASYPPEVAKYSPYAATQAALPNTEATERVRLTAAMAGRLFGWVKATNGLTGCQSKAKNIADTGARTLTEGAASCVFHYTEDKNVYAISTAFQGIAYTLDEGRKLEREHRYDRLGLDRETDLLLTAVKSGDALELGTIAPTLQSLVDDPQVLGRVRERAAKLLAQAAVDELANPKY